MTRRKNSNADLLATIFPITKTISFTSVGGAAAEAFTVNGARQNTHMAIANIRVVGGANTIQAVNITGDDLVTVTFNVDPTADTEITIFLISIL